MFSLLQASRFIAAWLVLGRHEQMVFAQPKYYDFHAPYGIFSGGVLGVDFFFVLSGFIICHAHWNEIGKPSRLPDYLRRRLQRIYPPYWAAAILILSAMYFVPSTYTSDLESPSYLARVFLLLPLQLNFVQVAWTLQHEMMFYLLFALLIANRTVGMVALGVWFVASGTIHGAAAPSDDVITDPRHIQFLLGMMSAFIARHHRVPVPGALLLLGVLAFAACVYVGGPGYGDLTAGGAPNLTITVGLASALIVSSLVELERRSGWRAPRPLRYLGDASYSLYLIHLPVLTVFARVAHARHLEAMIPVPVLFVMGMMVGLGAGIAFHEAVERPVQSLLRRRARSASAEAPVPAEEIGQMRGASARG